MMKEIKIPSNWILAIVEKFPNSYERGEAFSAVVKWIEKRTDENILPLTTEDFKLWLNNFQAKP